MEEGGSRIRRRVCVRKRDRPGLGCVPVTAAEAEKDDEEKDEEEMVAASRRRRTAGVQEAEVRPRRAPGLLAAVAAGTRTPATSCSPRPPTWDTRHGGLGTALTERIEKGARVFPPRDNTHGTFADLKTDKHTENQSGREDVTVEAGAGLLYDVPSSQVLYFENLQNSSDDLGDQSTKERDRNSPYHKTLNEESPHNLIEQPRQNDESSSKVGTSSDVNRRKSVKDHLKSAMTGNAKAQTPVFSRSKHLKETLLSEEMSVAKKTIESSSHDLGPFYSLPSKVRDLYFQFKGIEKLYGNAFLLEWKKKIFPSL
nr:helicase POLQ-like [Microcebus murinus]